jgi:uncharacterized membrane protein
MIITKPKREAFIFFLKVIFWVVVAVNAVLIFIKSLTYYSPDFNKGFLSDKYEVFTQTVYPYFFYGHISISSFILLVGIFQFSKKFRIKYTETHRWLGKVYIGLVLFVSAPSAFIMGIYATGNWGIKGGFVVASLLWWWFTYKAYLEIKKANTGAHRRFMQRSYIISLLAVFLRVYYYLIIAVFKIDSPYVYLFVVYASWLPNLLVFEALVWCNKTRILVSAKS